MAATPLAAADIKVPPIYGKAPPVQLQLWSGPYVGVNIGYGFGDWDSTGTWNRFDFAAAPDVNGVFGGIQGGYNWQFNQLVLGVEGDVQLGGISGSSDLVSVPGTPGVTCPKPTTKCSHAAPCAPTAAVPGYTVSGDWEMNWFSTIRGRAGVTFDGWLAYGTAGLAIADIDFSGATSGGKTKTGFVVGAGLEKIVARNWTVKAEYLFLDLGSATFQGAGTDAVTTDVQQHLMRVGANYHF